MSTTSVGIMCNIATFDDICTQRLSVVTRAKIMPGQIIANKCVNAYRKDKMQARQVAYGWCPGLNSEEKFGSKKYIIHAEFSGDSRAVYD
jgi:hypothetical protein